MPAEFCGTPPLSWRPSRSPAAGGKQWHNRSMRLSEPAAAAATGTWSPKHKTRGGTIIVETINVGT